MCVGRVGGGLHMSRTWSFGANLILALKPHPRPFNLALNTYPDPHQVLLKFLLQLWDTPSGPGCTTFADV